MTTPKDIDGNELKVGDDVELAKTGLARVGLEVSIGDRFLIEEISGPEYIRTVGNAFYAEFGEIKIVTNFLRLIPRDTKAPTKIEFVTTKEGVR